MNAERTLTGGCPQWTTTLALIHGLFWSISGVWPLIHRSSFERVTGPKVDYWAAEAAGVMIAICGMTMLIGRRRRRITAELIFMAVAGASALAAIDVVYVTRERISRAYLADAVIEVVLALAWIGASLSAGRSEESRQGPR